MAPDDILEVGAQGLVDSWWKGSQPGFDHKPPSWKASHMDAIRAALAAMEARGWVMVPVEPTERQVMAAKMPYEDLCMRDFAGTANWKDAFRVIYRAMLAATGEGQ